MISKNFVFNVKAVDISYFNYLFSIKHENYGGLTQQGCNEFLLFLLDDLSKEFNESKIVFTHRLLCDYDNKDKLYRYSEDIKLCRIHSKMRPGAASSYPSA